MYISIEDTDSLIYKYKGNKDPLKKKLGIYLGELTSELPKNSTLLAVTAPGPKAYAYQYRTENGEVVTKKKCRGMEFTSTADKKINFDSMKRQAKVIAKGLDEEPIVVKYRKIKRDADATLFDTTIRKRFKGVFTKRRVLRDYSTLPYGYVD